MNKIKNFDYLPTTGWSGIEEMGEPESTVLERLKRLWKYLMGDESLFCSTPSFCTFLGDEHELTDSDELWFSSSSPVHKYNSFRPSIDLSKNFLTEEKL